MTLTAEERRRLRTIEEVLAQQDPGLAARLRPATPPAPRRAAGRRVLGGSLVVLFVGSWAQQPLVCLVGWMGLTVGILLGYA